MPRCSSVGHRPRVRPETAGDALDPVGPGVVGVAGGAHDQLVGHLGEQGRGRRAARVPGSMAQTLADSSEHSYTETPVDPSRISDGSTRSRSRGRPGRARRAGRSPPRRAGRRTRAEVRSRPANRTSMCRSTRCRSACACAGRGGSGSRTFSTIHSRAPGAIARVHDPQDAHAVLVVPVVEDARQHVGVAALRDLARRSRPRRSRTGRRGRPPPSAPPPPRATSGRSATTPRTSRFPAQQRLQQRAVPAADVDDQVDVRQVAGSDDRRRPGRCRAGPSTR